MKTVAIAALTLVLCANVKAGDYKVDNSPLDPTDCERVDSYATFIMLFRQRGESLTEIMGMFEDQPFLQQMVMSAYGRERQGEWSDEKDAVQDFQNDMTLECYKLKQPATATP